MNTCQLTKKLLAKNKSTENSPSILIPIGLAIDSSNSSATFSSAPISLTRAN